MERFDAISDRIDVGVRGLHVGIDLYSTRLPNLEACFLSQFHVGTDTDRHDRQLAGEFRPVLKLDPRQFPILAEKPGNAVIGDDVCPLGPHMVFNQLCKLPVKKGQQLRKELDHGDPDAGQMKGLAGLDPDQAAADDHRLFDLPLVPDFAEKISVLHGLERGDPLQLHARNGRHLRHGTGREDQLVVGHLPRFPGQRVPERDGSRFPVDGGHLRVHPGRDILGVQVELGVPYHPRGGADEHVPVVEVPADVIGIAAGSHGQVRILLQDDHLGIVIDSPGLCRCLGTGGGTSDNHDPSSFLHCLDLPYEI